MHKCPNRGLSWISSNTFRMALWKQVGIKSRSFPRMLQLLIKIERECINFNNFDLLSNIRVVALSNHSDYLNNYINYKIQHYPFFIPWYKDKWWLKKLFYILNYIYRHLWVSRQCISYSILLTDAMHIIHIILWKFRFYHTKR